MTKTQSCHLALFHRWNSKHPPKERFIERVGKPNPNGCTEWTGCKNPDGYGLFRTGGKHFMAHRYAWEMAHGEIPKGLLVCHKCDNPSCCNIDHLFVGTQKDNISDCFRKGRGVSNPRRKINSTQISEIRLLRESGMTLSAIGHRYGVSYTTIQDIIANRTWRSV